MPLPSLKEKEQRREIPLSDLSIDTFSFKSHSVVEMSIHLFLEYMGEEIEALCVTTAASWSSLLRAAALLYEVSHFPFYPLLQ